MKSFAILVIVMGAFSAHALDSEEGDIDSYLHRFRRQATIDIFMVGDNGKYLSRINRGPNYDPIEAEKPARDAFCKFTLEQHDDGLFSFRADNGKYLSRIYRDGVQAIEAAKSTVDPFSKFHLKHSGPRRLSILADNGKYWARVERGPINPIEAVATDPDTPSAIFRIESP